MKLKMMEFRVLVEQWEKEKEIDGIFLPETAKQEQQLFTVISVGEFACDGEIKEGDVVIISKYAGTEIVLENHKYRIVSEDEILAKAEII